MTLTTPPRVSVLMTTYNGAPLIGESIASILKQSFSDFELVVVDDNSTDQTPGLLSMYQDPRLRILRTPRNLGVAGARNFGIAQCRGAYIAALDHDDLSHPDRLALQTAYLDQHPHVVLVGSDVQIMEYGQLRPSLHAKGATPLLMRWLLHVDNPLTYSSIMLRAEAIRALGGFMRKDYQFADDYDLYHRLLGVGDIARLDQALTIYRWHASNTSHTEGAALLCAAQKILIEAYTPWLGVDAAEAALLVARYCSTREPPDRPALRRLGGVLERILTSFLASYATNAADLTLIETHASLLWWQTTRGTIRNGAPLACRDYFNRASLRGRFVPAVADVATSIGIGTLRTSRSGRALLAAIKRRPERFAVAKSVVQRPHQDQN